MQPSSLTAKTGPACGCPSSPAPPSASAASASTSASPSKKGDKSNYGRCLQEVPMATLNAALRRPYGKARAAPPTSDLRSLPSDLRPQPLSSTIQLPTWSSPMKDEVEDFLRRVAQMRAQAEAQAKAQQQRPTQRPQQLEQQPNQRE